ncbi:MAG: hypothetical protein ACOZQL_22440 [Myxococcota bacterium]
MTLALASLAVLLAAAPPKAAADKLSKLHLAWNAPTSLKEAPVSKNEAMEYDVALRSPDKKFEVRVSLRPAVPPSKPAPGTKEVRVPDENVFPALVQATLLNLSAGGAAPNLKPFSPKTLTKEFAAEQGFTAYVDPKAEGWNAYAHCMMYALRRAGRGEVYVFFLFDDFEEVKGPVLEAFHLVKFEK